MRKTRFLIVSVLALLLAIAAARWVWQRYLNTPLAVPADGYAYLVERGDTFGQVAHDLAAKGLLERPQWLLAYARLSGRGHRIHAGEYQLEQGLTPLMLLTKMERGDVRQYAVTLVEGWTVGQALRALHAAPALKQTLPPGEVDALMARLPVDQQRFPHPEGLFFPDTYYYHRGMSDAAILTRAYRRLVSVLDQQWEQRAPGLPYNDPYEALIMASIVERETGVPDERPQIAGVFVRRLESGMRLQTDPTVIYGLGADFDGNLRSVHLKDAANPYNTYRHGGLPPTPIALAGREAIRAALNPAPGDTLYFVAKGDGSHYFSVTLEEHLQAVRRFQLQRRSDYRSSPPSGTGEKTPAPSP